jgi:hypothetical protein
MAKEIGLGPSLFLMQTKGLMWYFLFMSLMTLPIMMIYRGQDHSASHSNYGDWKINKMETMFYEASLGHMVYDTKVNNALQWKNNETIWEACTNSADIKKGNVFCGVMRNKPFYDTELEKLPHYINKFNTCCLYHPEELQLMLVFFEIFVFVIGWAFLVRLEASIRTYVKNFKDQTIEMDDFALVFEQCPKDSEFDGKDDTLRMVLNTHFEKALETGAKQKDERR